MSESDEREILAQRERWKNAVEAGDIDRIQSFYAPGDVYVLFDLNPPLEYKGAEASKHNWQNFFSLFDAPPAYEFAEQRVFCASSGDVAFVHGLSRIRGAMSGRPLDMWSRETNCFRKIGNSWLIVHDHVSVPSISFRAEPKPTCGLEER